MSLGITLKDKARESRLLRERVLTALIVVLLLASVLIYRMVHLQVISHDHFATLSEKNRVKIEPIPPTRGLIYDRNGVVLAQNQPSFSLEVVPEAVENMSVTLQGLAEIIDNREADLERFRKLLKRKRAFEGIPLRFHLSEEEVARFAVNRHRFPGVDIEARLTRHYPLGATAAHVVGYVGRIDEQELQHLDTANYSGTSHLGKTGVEKAYESVLHGRVGYQHVETNAQGRTLRILDRTPPQPGDDLAIDIDVSLQAVAEAALAAENGAVVAIEPRTGGILALVSTPGYDPNLFVNGIDSKQYADLQGSPNRPLFNRALRGQYPPGSTVKPFVGLAGLEYEAATSDKETWCPGWYKLPGRSHRYRDWKRSGHGKLDLNGAITQSCDVFFYDLALELGIDRIHGFMSRFGFGEKTGVDIGGEISGLMPSREWKRAKQNQPWYPGETLITGIGQGFTLATPLQLATATASLAQRGTRLQPRVVHAVIEPEAGKRVELDPVGQPEVALRDAALWDMVIEGMVEVVHGTRGTARRIGLDAPYNIAGKT